MASDKVFMMVDSTRPHGRRPRAVGLHTLPYGDAEERKLRLFHAVRELGAHRPGAGRSSETSADAEAEGAVVAGPVVADHLRYEVARWDDHTQVEVLMEEMRPRVQEVAVAGQGGRCRTGLGASPLSTGVSEGLLDRRTLLGRARLDVTGAPGARTAPWSRPACLLTDGRGAPARRSWPRARPAPPAFGHGSEIPRLAAARSPRT